MGCDTRLRPGQPKILQRNLAVVLADALEATLSRWSRPREAGARVEPLLQDWLQHE